MEPIRQYIEAHREDMIRFWEKLVNMQGSSREMEMVNRVIDFLKEGCNEYS